MKINWQLLDEMFASFARPYQIYICSTSVAASLPLAIYMKAGDLTISAISASAAGIAGYTGYLRTADLKTRTTAANAAATGAATVTPAPTTP